MASQAQSAQDVLIFEESGSPVGSARAAQDVVIFESTSFPTHNMSAAQEVLIIEIPNPLSARQIIGGNFQDPSGNPLAYGTLTVRINTDAVFGTQQIAAKSASTPLDANGNIASILYLFPNSAMSPSTTVYVLRAYSAAGLLVWQSENVIPSGSGAFNIGSLVPLY